MRKLLITGVLLLLPAVCPLDAHALTCAGRSSAEQMLKVSDAAFVGKVLTVDSVDQRPKDTGILYNNEPFVIVLQAEKSWKGINNPRVVVFDDYFSDDERDAFRAGGRYLVYARARPDGLLVAGGCQSAVPVNTDGARDDVRTLDTKARAKVWVEQGQ